MSQSNATSDRILAFIIAHKRKHDGNAPTLREIMHACNLKSTCSVSLHLITLARAGKIELPRKNPRSIQVRGGAWTYQEQAG